jgi:tetratricopeptide (TPR) repeat protein
VTINPGQSRQAQIASLLRRARAAEAAGRVPETISFLRDVVQLDPHDRTTLRRLGDLFRLRMNRLREAASWYARAARANEREELPVRAIAIWRTVLQCDPLHVEAHERIGALYVETGHPADARLHYEKSERVLRAAGLGRDAAILGAQRMALGDAAPAVAVPAANGETAVHARPITASSAPPAPEPPPVPDAEALALATERLANGRSFHHYGLHTEARRQLEELLAMMPEHVEARQMLAEVCRTLGDTAAAARHLDTLVQVMRRRGQVEPPPADDPLCLPPMEEWILDAADPCTGLGEEIRGDVERLVDHLKTRAGEG